MNPVTYARYLAGNISTSALSRRLNVSRQYISRLEQGLYDKPNQQLLDWTVSALNRNRGADKKPVSHAAVEQLYKEWQWQKRESCKMNRLVRPVEVTEHQLARQKAKNRGSDIIYYHQIFVDWRSDYWTTTHAFCVDMCLHPSPVVDYEEGHTHTMPNSLKKVMTQLNLLGEGFKTNEN
jgi:transcriptional regulator with XRE-family HTH domain